MTCRSLLSRLFGRRPGAPGPIEEAPPTALLPRHLEEWLAVVDTASCSTAIRQHVEHYLEADPVHEMEEQAREAAVSVGALPCRFDRDGCHLLHPSGAVYFAAWDGEGEPLIEAEPLFRWATIAAAAVAHPELVDLVPPRPADAVACHECDAAEGASDALCPSCGGLGWVPSGESPR